MFRFYAVLTHEKTGERTTLQFSDNYEFACAALSAGELGCDLLRVTKGELTKDEVAEVLYFETDKEFCEHFGLSVN